MGLCGDGAVLVLLHPWAGLSSSSRECFPGLWVWLGFGVGFSPRSGLCPAHTPRVLPSRLKMALQHLSNQSPASRAPPALLGAPGAALAARTSRAVRSRAGCWGRAVRELQGGGKLGKAAGKAGNWNSAEELLPPPPKSSMLCWST